MPRIIRTARGEQVDFDTIIIKQQLAQAPMNVEVARRKEFIDSKEGKVRGAARPSQVSVDTPINQNTFVSNEPVRVVVPGPQAEASPTPGDFEIESAPTNVSGRVAEPDPILPERKRK